MNPASHTEFRIGPLDRTRLERSLGPVDLDGIEIIALDEFAIQKGHRYATVVVEPTST